MVPWPSEHEENDVRDVVCAHHPRESVLGPPSSGVECEVGRHAARADIRAADAAFTQLMIERARESDLRELRGAVDRLERKTATPRLRRERADVRLAALEQMRERGTRGIERPFHVDVDHLLEEVGRKFEEGTIRTDARVRDQDVES